MLFFAGAHHFITGGAKNTQKMLDVLARLAQHAPKLKHTKTHTSIQFFARMEAICDIN